MTLEHPSDPEPRTLQLPDGPMVYTDEGDGPALLLVHGYPGGPRDYRWLAPALPGFRVIRIQLPGMGGTPLSTGPATSVTGRAELVVQACDVLGLQDFGLVGHSMGGGIAICAAAALGPRVRALVLLASIGVRPHHSLRRWNPKPWAWLLGTFMRPVLVPMVVKGFSAAGFPPVWDEPALLHTLDCAAGIDFDGIEAALGSIAVPTLLAWAEDDPHVEPAIGAELVARLPEGPRLSWPTGGHNIQKSHAVEIGAAIAAMLEAR